MILQIHRSDTLAPSIDVSEVSEFYWVYVARRPHKQYKDSKTIKGDKYA